MPTGSPSAPPARSRDGGRGAWVAPGVLTLPGTWPVLLRERGPGPRGERAAILAEDTTGARVGRAEYARVYGPRAVLAVDVEDRFWPLGLPEALVASLCGLAARHGISTLLARVGERDAALNPHGDVVALGRDAGAGESIASHGGVLRISRLCGSQSA
jgi:hypothetical protein